MLGRLGQGGMGTVFLAESPSGSTVAVKVIRTDRAGDAEFRQRFRGEVSRAHQVPPFCTAEVLDADPDHDPPYLVVEYVDGPSLATVVAERGPLTAANLHGLAIGVATALTAIHGAGVIHRDLKPSNVLLPPGSPKVIDFGISRFADGGAGLTRTDQMIGTVAYMAPERFEPGTYGPVTTAADVFAWGAVVAFAGTGRTPFAADNAPATAMRILTGPPDLDGLDGLLRTLVEQALARDPADRPSARELLDRLLSAGPRRSAELTSALADQPALRSAAEQAYAATDQQPTPVRLAGPSAATSVVADAPVTVPAPVREPAVGPEGASTTPADAGGPAGPAGDPSGPRPAGRRRRGPLAAVAFVVLVALVAGAGFLSGHLEFRSGADGAGTPTAPVVPSSPGVPTSADEVRDPLTRQRYWWPVSDEQNRVTCQFSGGLMVTKQSEGVYRCQGPAKAWLDVRVDVDVEIVEPDSCAAVWFRFTVKTGGYALRVCQRGYFLVTHGVASATSVVPVQSFPFPDGERPGLGTPVRVGIEARGGRLRFFRDGREVGSVDDGDPIPGRVVLGIFHNPPEDGEGTPPFQVRFRNVEIRALD
jgi:hypothetical protein